VSMGGAKVVVSSLAPVLEPTHPDVVLAPGESTGLYAGQAYYQARVRLQNGGRAALRIDPYDFSLVGKGRLVAPDPSASGPPARSLLPGASLDLILTFRGPAGLAPVLVYDPLWFNGSLRVTGDRKPEGQSLLQLRADG
jgi:hypothetical protein